MTDFRWLITGGSSGIGSSLATEAQRQGYHVFATARNTTKAAQDNPEFEKLGGTWIQLDVQSPDTEKTVRRLVEEEGINVIVNNAGVALLGAFEDMSEEEIFDQMNTNYFGAVRVMKGAIPVFGERRAGTIVNVSSAAAFLGLPSRSVYAASKAALEATTEAVAAELQDFDVRVFMVDLGAFRTNFATTAATPKAHEVTGGVSKAYSGSMAETVIRKTRELAHSAPGDPDQAACRIIESVTSQGMAGEERLRAHQRIILGSDSLGRAREKLKMFAENIDAMEGVAASTDFKTT